MKPCLRPLVYGSGTCYKQGYKKGIETMLKKILLIFFLVIVVGLVLFFAINGSASRENGFRTVLDYQNGQWAEMDPIRNGIEVPLPQGGTITSYPYASFDPIGGSLPNDLSSVSPVEMVFSPLPPQLHDLLRGHASRILGGEIDSDTAVSSFYDTIERDPHRWLTLPDDFVAPAKIWARAVGRKEGRAARHSCWLKPALWDLGGYFLTSAALVVAVLKILRGEIQARGVMHAETAFDPLPFFDEVAGLVPDALPDSKLIRESFEWL